MAALESHSKSLGSKRAMVTKTSKSGVLSAKAARKIDVQNTSDSSDSHITSSDSRSAQSAHHGSDSDARRPRHHSQGIMRLPGHSNLVTKSAARKVTFEDEDDAESDDGTLRADPSPRHAPQGLPPARPAFPLPIERVAQVKKAVRRGAQGLQDAAANLNNRPSKSTRHHNLDRLTHVSWKGTGPGRKEHKKDQRRYSRMSIGSTSRQRSPRRSDTSTDEDGLDCYVRDGVVVSLGENLHEELYGQRIAKAARKRQVGKKSIPRPSSSLGQPSADIPDNLDMGNPEIRENLDSVSDNEDENLSLPTAPSESLLEVLEKISSTTLQLQRLKRLPFLCRNLQKSFLLTCQSCGVDIEDCPTPQASISVVYSYKPAVIIPQNSEVNPIVTTRSFIKDWTCPFCNLYGKFPNLAMLNKHLSWDHPSIEVVWSQDHTILFLNIHDPNPTLSIKSTPQVANREAIPDSLPSRTQSGNIQKADTDQNAPEVSSSTSSIDSIESNSTTFLNSQDKLKYSTRKYTAEAEVSSGSRNTSVSEDMGVSQDHQKGSGLGPMATFPYLPESNESGIVYYSCRPGGPRLFDILNTQPLKPFGVLKWLIVDREEELFELDNILDEDKVMQALWFRWIFLNRNKFVANYFDGTKTFITENWQLIREGAGLLALRAWLLVLAVNKFLLGAEVATLMRYYQELAGLGAY